MKFLVTGCPRSGTGYTVDVLRGLGIATGWEAAFDPTRAEPDFGWQDGEVAWEAVPYLAKLKGVPIAHQVRHPLAVIESMFAMGILGNRKPAHRRYIYRHMPQLRRSSSELERCAEFWLRWNLACEGLVTVRYRVEDMQPSDLAPLIGYEPAALPPVLETTNPLGKRSAMRRRSIGWDDLPTRLAKQIRDLAESYGYGFWVGGGCTRRGHSYEGAAGAENAGGDD